MTVAGVDLRCPVDSRRLFARVKFGDVTIVEGNLIEIAYNDCRASLRKMGEDVRLVLHRFNVLGECVETERL